MLAKGGRGGYVERHKGKKEKKKKEWCSGHEASKKYHVVAGSLSFFPFSGRAAKVVTARVGIKCNVP